MKTRFLYFILLAFLFSACSQEEINNVETSKEPTKDSGYRFYGVKQVDKGSTKGTAVLNKLWHTGTPITIKFLDGTAAMQDQVKQYAAEWLNYAGLSFNYVGATDKADVRISFGMNDTRYVTWSYTGTDCKTVTDQTKATMNFAFWNESTAQEQKGDVLRAFGQMMGLEFEHRHLALNPTWGSNIQNYWTQDISDIPWETLKEYVMTPLSSANTVTTKEYDPSSIMIWPFVGRGLVTYNTGYTVPSNYNSELSALDKEFIAQLYPIVEEQILTFSWDAISGMYSIFQRLEVFNNQTVRIEWGDGTSTIELSCSPDPYENGKNLEHKYPAVGTYTVKVFGHRTAITVLALDSISSIDVSKCYGLRRLTISGLKLSTINVTNNVNLEFLNVKKTNISSLDVRSCLRLSNINCQENSNLTSLDLKNNQLLEYIYVPYNNLTDLKLPNNKNVDVEYLSFYNNQLTSVDLSNTRAGTVSAENNNISSLNISNSDFDSAYFGYNPLSYLSISSTKIDHLSLDNNLLNSINLVNGTNIDNFEIYNNPIVTNKTALTSFVNSLPYGTSPYGNNIILNNATSAEWIKSIANAKNWQVYF